MAEQNMRYFPEILDEEKQPNPYEVKYGPPAVGLKERQLYMGSERDVSAYRHELGHILWSPTKKPGRNDMEKEIYNAVEDGRINAGLHHNDLPIYRLDELREVVRTSASTIEPSTVERGKKVFSDTDKEAYGDPFRCLLMMLATIGTDLGSTEGIELLKKAYVVDEMPPELEMLYEEAHRVLYTEAVHYPNHVAPFSEVERIVNTLLEMMDEDSRPEPLPPRKRRSFTSMPSGGEGEGSKPTDIMEILERLESWGHESREDTITEEFVGSLEDLVKTLGGTESTAKEASAKDTGKGELPTYKPKKFDFKVSSRILKYSPSEVKADLTDLVKSKLSSLDYSREGDKKLLESASLTSISSAVKALPRTRRWIEPKVQRAKMVDIQKLLPSAGKAKYRSGTEGSVIRSIHRMPIDGAIFRVPNTRRQGWYGGTILIDVSGSMRIGISQLLLMLENAPHSTTIALYSGSGDSKTARITVVAQSGKCTDGDWLADNRSKVFLVGNTCDGPALEWLGRQPKPRVWICDGGVTGYGDRSNELLTLHADKLMMENEIIRYYNVGSAIRHFKYNDTSLAFPTTNNHPPKDTYRRERAFVAQERLVEFQKHIKYQAAGLPSSFDMNKFKSKITNDDVGGLSGDEADGYIE